MSFRRISPILLASRIGIFPGLISSFSSSMTRFYTQARRPLFPHYPLRKRLLPMMMKVNDGPCLRGDTYFFFPDDRLVRVMLQRWLQRICEDAILLQDEELRLFVESDFGVRSPISDLSPF